MADEKKIYIVAVEIRQEVIVVATSKEDAEKVALEHYEEDFDNGNERDVETGIVNEITKPGHFTGTLPWGVEDKHPRRNWTIDQWLEGDA